MAVTVEQLAFVTGQSSKAGAADNALIVARLTALIAVATTEVTTRTTGLALPTGDEGTALTDELTLRLAAYLYDDPKSDERRSLAPMWLYSGCAALVAPYRRRRALTTRGDS